MIFVCGGIKGGVGKSTIVTNMTVMRANQGMDVLLIESSDKKRELALSTNPHVNC